MIGGRSFPIRSLEEYERFFAENGDNILLWRSHEMVLAGFALAFETTITLVALIPSSPAHYQLQHFKPEDIDYIDTIPDLPANLPGLCTRSGLLFHSSSHYQVILTCNLTLQLLKVISNDAQGGVLQCPTCGPTYMPTSCPATFHEHLTTAHLAPPSSPTTSSAPPPASPTTTPASPTTSSAPPPASPTSSNEDEQVEKQTMDEQVSEEIGGAGAVGGGMGARRKAMYPCNHCRKTYTSRINLATHEKKRHLEIAEESCAHCQFRGVPFEIERHQRKSHLPNALKINENLWECNLCGLRKTRTLVR